MSEDPFLAVTRGTRTLDRSVQLLARARPSSMEIGSSHESLPSTAPSWVVVDQDIYRKTITSFHHGDRDDHTSATTRTSTGEVVAVSFTLHALPGSSRLYLHLPKRRKLSGWDRVVAAHRNAVLFSLEVDFDGLPSSCSAIDHFIYWARPSPHCPSITLLPRWYSTEEEIAAAEPGSWRRNPWMALGRRGTGLLVSGDDFVVAELVVHHQRYDDVDAPLEAELFRLCWSSERIAAGGAACEWEEKHAMARGGKATFGDLLCWWDTIMVIPYGSYLCWVDYSRGLIFCDVNHPYPDLQYVSLPVDHIPAGYPDPFVRGCPQASRAVCVTENETLKFINVARSDGILSGVSEPGSGFTITVSTLHDGYDGMSWVTDTTIQAAELWDMEGYDDQLPRIAPQFPLVSMDDPNIIYVVLMKPNYTVSSTKAWVVALNIDSSKVLWYKDIKTIPLEEDIGMDPGNIFCNAPFFTSEFTKHLRKADVR